MGRMAEIRAELADIRRERSERASLALTEAMAELKELAEMQSLDAGSVPSEARRLSLVLEREAWCFLRLAS